MFPRGWEIARLSEGIAERPYVLVRFNTWLILLSMALTSTRDWIRQLGPRWKSLHALVYAALVLGLCTTD